MILLFHSLSVAGPKGKNQDCLLEPTRNDGEWWCAIADGVGGSDLGEVASRLCIDTVRQQLVNGKTMEELFCIVADKLSEKAQSATTDQTMSSTLSILRLVGKQAFVGHVGDTRITHYRNGGVVTRTRDQTEVQQLLDDGVLTKYQARRYPRKNVILSAMSPKRSHTLFESSFDVELGDRILLTTDGFHHCLQKRTIAYLSEKGPDFRTFFQSIERELSQVVLEDDATVLAIEVS